MKSPRINITTITNGLDETFAFQILNDNGSILTSNDMNSTERLKVLLQLKNGMRHLALYFLEMTSCEFEIHMWNGKWGFWLEDLRRPYWKEYWSYKYDTEEEALWEIVKLVIDHLEKNEETKGNFSRPNQEGMG